MRKIPNLVRLAPPLALLIFGAVSCNRGGGRQPETPINPDTVRHHVISIQEADAMTANFRAAIDSMDQHHPHFKDSLDFGHAEAFPADVFRELLRQSDSAGPAVGIRIYYGRDENGRIRQILVPVDSAGNDIVNHMIDTEVKTAQPSAGGVKVGNGQAVENGQRCPTACDTGSSGLN